MSTDSDLRNGVQIGIDIGGTFTDFLLVDPVNNTFAVHKTLTTPQDPSLAVLEGLVDSPERFRRRAIPRPPDRARNYAGHQCADRA